MAKKEEIKITALYERLSRDDEQAGESNSIQNHFFRLVGLLLELFGKSKQFRSDSSPASSVRLSIILLFAYDFTISHSVLHFELVRNSYKLPLA